MKSKKLLLVGMIALSTQLYANNTLADILKDGKFNGEIKTTFAFGSDTDVGVAKGVDNKNVGSGAIELNYITGSFYGFSLGLGVQSALDYKMHGKDGSSADDSRDSVQDTSVHQAFLKYKFLNSNIKIGKQIIRTPMILNSSSFPLKDSFNAGVFTLNEIPNTSIKFMYIKRWNKRYGDDASSSITQKDIHYDDPVYSIYLRNKSIENLTLEAQFLTTDNEGNNGDLPIMTTDGYTEYFARGTYKFNTSIPLTLGLTYGGASFDQANEDNTNFYGIKLGTSINDIKLALSYTSVDEDNDFIGTLGHVPDTMLYSDMLITDPIYAGLDAVSLEAKYNFGIKMLNTKLKYTHFEQSDEGMDNSGGQVNSADEVNLDIKYDFSGFFKGLSFLAKLGYANYDLNVKKDDVTYGRYYLSFKF